MLDEPPLLDARQLRDSAGQNPHDLIDAFVRSSPALLAQMEQAIRERDRDKLYRAGHTLISAANCVGATAVAEQCKLVLEERVAGRWPPLQERLQSLYAKTCDALASLPADEVTSERETPPAPERRHTVLLLEDNGVTRAAVHTALDPYFRVIDAETDEMAHALCETETPAAALVDLNLSFAGRGNSGLDVIRQIKDWLPVIVLTVDDSVSTIRAANRAGAWSYLIKQPTPRQLFATLDAAIGRFRETRAARAAPNRLDLATGWFMATYQLAYPEARRLIQSVAATQRRRIADVLDDALNWHAMDTSIRQIGKRLFGPSDRPPTT